jgi:hypothetical protein
MPPVDFFLPFCVTASDLPALLGIRIGGKFDCCIKLNSVEFMNGMLHVSAPLLAHLLIFINLFLTPYFMPITKERRSCFVYFEGTLVWEYAGAGSPKFGRTGGQKLKTN